jgi:hypothetical protein
LSPPEKSEQLVTQAVVTMGFRLMFGVRGMVGMLEMFALAGLGRRHSGKGEGRHGQKENNFFHG